MKKLLIGILIVTLHLCIIWSIIDQAQQGAKYQAARVAAEAGRR